MTNRWKGGVYGMTPTRIRLKPLNTIGRKRPLREHPGYVHVDLTSLLSIEHVCRGCARTETCCCARYEVCVNSAELNKIIQVLPYVAKLCPHLRTANGYDNVFEEVEPGLYAIDTTEDNLCVFAFLSDNTIRCSLHAVALTLGLPLARVKPKACLLWPLSFSEGDEVLSLSDDALSFGCNSLRKNSSHRLSPTFVEAIGHIYGEVFRTRLEEEAKRGVQRTMLLRAR
jgi:hypothetical protein